jgi:hypothetical protein
MQLNILQLYLNDLVNFLQFLNYQHFYMNWIIHFELIDIIIQTLHIALTNIYWNTHNNLMLHIYISMG